MVSDTLCRCICGTDRSGEFLEKGEWAPRAPSAAPPAEVLEEDDKKPKYPQVTGRLCYSMLADQQLRGVPIREGELWHLSTEEKVDPIHFVLHVNGFTFVADGQEMSISLSPFTLVRNCKFQSTYPSLNISDFKIFKISLFAQGACYYFGVRGEDERQAEEERSRWVLDISRAMRLVTQSLFPPFRISCQPLREQIVTHSRLLAGYLVHFDDSFTASVLYCELHPQSEDQAKLILYENERCQAPVMYIYITERSICCEKIGINCSCFSVEDHQFSARTLSERKLWLRAISNLKVKLQNRAPEPSEEDISDYRNAIQEHVTKLQASFDGQVQTDALLQRTFLRKPPSPKFAGQACLDTLGSCPLPPPENGTQGSSLPVAPPRPQQPVDAQEPAESPDAISRDNSGGDHPTSSVTDTGEAQDADLTRSEPQPLRRSSSLNSAAALPSANTRASRRKQSWPSGGAQELQQPTVNG